MRNKFNNTITIGNWSIMERLTWHISESGSKYEIHNNNIFDIIDGYYDWMLHLATRNPFTEQDVLDFNKVLLYHANLSYGGINHNIYQESLNLQKELIKDSRNLYSRNNRLI